MARKSKIPTDMSALFNSTSGTLAQIAAKTNSLTILSDIVRQICPDLPEDVWKIANFKGKSIVIEVNSAVWSQRLQFERMNICRELTQVTENEFNQIEIKITPYRTKIPAKTVYTRSKQHHYFNENRGTVIRSCAKCTREFTEKIREVSCSR